ncbi:hypothetical protein [Sulfobacillus thermosulfidooxidans]|uniref:hypothetical protein n=1 Tax=Sulfobacillus thermosulfidooxidans TaxID=28034 RepID=UPI0006B4C790|nr:hypothetical protein [Sulfobacillus thermosulfidooxidans]
MAKRFRLPSGRTPLLIVWRRPWQALSAHGLRDLHALYAVYWSSIAITALLVSLYQFFSILPAREVIIRILLGIGVVYAGGYVFLHALIFSTQQILSMIHYPDTSQQIPWVVLSLGPWIAGISLVAVLTSTYWICDLLGILALLFFMRQLARSVNIPISMAATVIGIEIVPVLAILFYWAWVRGWNFYPFW